MATEQNSVTAETDRGLKVIPRDHGQFEIRNTHPPVRDWDREYVCVSGYFGPHSPELFAAAPELLEVVQTLRDYVADAAGGHCKYADGATYAKLASEDLARIDAALAAARPNPTRLWR